MLTPMQQINAMRGWYAMQGETVEIVFVECIECGAEATGEGSMTDKQAVRYFKRKGWTVSPTRCPKHAKEAQTNEPQKP